MAAHRYWRAVALEAYGAGDLELSCFHLLDAAGVRVDAPATLTASVAPTIGALANLQDDDLTTAARWPVQSIATLALAWDFGGSPADVLDIRLAGNGAARFLLMCKLQYSDDAATWVDALPFYGIAWPGVGTKTASTETGNRWSKAGLIDPATLSANDGTFSVSLPPEAVGCGARGFLGASAGALQFEITVISNPAGYGHFLGVGTSGCQLAVGVGSGYSDAKGFTVFTGNGSKYGGGFGGATYSTAIGAGTVLGVVVDFSARTLTFYRNGVSMGVAYTNVPLSTVFYPLVSTVCPTPASGSVSLKTKEFAYPVAGAAEWGGKPSLDLNRIQGRVAPQDAVTLGTGLTIIYGIPQVVEPVNLTIESGSVKDYTTGVMGSGRGRVAGTVKEKGTPDAPVYRKVRLIREKDGLLIREVWSDPVTGAYSFDFIDELQKFTVLSYDHTGAFRAVVADGQIPELIA